MGIRDVIIFAIVFGCIPFILRKPWIGVLCWAWLGLMNPHRLTYGLAYEFPFSQLIALVTLVGFVITRDTRRFLGGAPIVFLILFTLWTSFTTPFALNLDASLGGWVRFMKILAVVYLALFLFHERKQIDALVWVIVLSIGYFHVKGGIFTIANGGENRVWGPIGSFIEENNSLALAGVMVVPLVFYLYQTAERRIVKWGLAGATLLMCASILGSHSRGALLGISAMLAFLWLKSRKKMLLGVMFLVAGPTLFAFMPSHWHERMQTITTYSTDLSALGRIYAWQTAVNAANHRVVGVGFDLATVETYERFGPPDVTVYRTAHSIYFQVLGEHGYVGLIIFLGLLFFTWRHSSKMMREVKGRPELAWAGSLAAMVQVSLIGFCVGGAFLNLAFWDLPYYLVVLVVAARAIVKSPIIAKDAQELGGQQILQAPVFGRAG